MHRRHLEAAPGRIRVRPAHFDAMVHAKGLRSFLFLRHCMEASRKFWRLPFSTQTLLVRSTLLIGLFRLALRVLPFRLVFGHVNRMKKRRGAPPRAYDHSPEQLAWAINAVGHRVLVDKPCLTLALATLVLFKRRGYPAKLHIGVAKDDRGQLQAHAWIESEDKVIVGDLENLSVYTPLPSIEKVP